jgi:glycine betaine/proline transport system substrate-binding protein
MRPLKRALSAIVMACAIATAGVAGIGAPARAAEKSVTIGWTAWSDAEFVTKLTKRILEDRMDVQVNMTMADIGIQYQGIKKGDLDFMMMAWLPNTHQDYWKKVRDEADSLGILYTDAILGWAVPAYVDDKIQSIADLKGNADMFDGKIQGIDPGAGLMRLSANAMKEYGLDDYELVSASGAAMTAALERAIRRKEPIVVTTWKPHWMFGKWKLRMLKDPRKALGSEENVRVIARPGFYQDMPDVAAFLSRIYLPLDELQTYMFKASESSYDEAVDEYIKKNPARINYWVTGEIQCP